jgi:antitoxin CptB
MDENRETRLKRLRIRSWRRGIKEMDMLLGPYADGPLRDLDDAGLAAFEALLEENDRDLYAWISGVAPVAQQHAQALALIAAFHQINS